MARQRLSRWSANLWVKLASGVLVAFTVFVLLDTFAIARVQQTVQEIDTSSIVQAQQAVAQESGGVSYSAHGSYADSADATDGAAATDSAAAADSADATEGAGATDGAAAAESAQGAGSSSAAQGGSQVESAASQLEGATVVDTYSDENMRIEVSSLRAYDTDIYIADVQVSSAEYLKTAFAQNAFGRNLKETTSSIASTNGAVLAVNGDYYGFRDDGYVLRNGVLYRSEASADTDALVVYGDGSMAAVSEQESSADDIANSGAWQVLSFGPTLVEDAQVAVGENDEVDQAMRSNPRTAIGMVSPLHYVVVVSDGRTDQSVGLSLYELAQVMQNAGATFAYNLDGGGSTTMYFNGNVVNNPSSGHRSGEREVSDIVYFG